VTTRKNVSEDNNISEEAGFGDGMWTWWLLLGGYLVDSDGDGCEGLFNVVDV